MKLYVGILNGVILIAGGALLIILALLIGPTPYFYPYPRDYLYLLFGAFLLFGPIIIGMGIGILVSFLTTKK